ncbi:hypothetical protein L198_04914 [Cryptococcus wingfieldii CBS 7118]|uniref:Uncharacterized protein n=1 Tax=Cryptococcus wingfieldii CBS 7118 TaxID=1295528 RepID=A0A1E3J1L2_9TREE|nr:hypothetical protein L198_04914 [Cryptococcus wingfieldii CBS 7118]ODN94770.1 hypothetical protein L198_04914 [Cryptococcus wingfieldii CBS 7118]
MHQPPNTNHTPNHSPSHHQTSNSLPHHRTTTTTATQANHVKTPSADHLMVPERADTATERRRRESLDTIGRERRAAEVAHQVQHHHQGQAQAQPAGKGVKSFPSQAQIYAQQARPAQVRALPNVPPAPAPAQVQANPSYPQPRPQPSRHLSQSETIYPTPTAAQQAFLAERLATPSHRKVPEPHTSSASRRRRASSGSSGAAVPGMTTLSRVDSDRSIRSRVSFDSTRSRGSQRTLRSDLGYESDGDSQPPGPTIFFDHSKNGNGGLAGTFMKGPGGEPVEVIGLGTKRPKHRTYASDMLKPILRSSSRMTISRTNTAASMRPQNQALGQQVAEKPLPSRPMSVVGSVMGSFKGQKTLIRTRSRSKPGSGEREGYEQVERAPVRAENGPRGSIDRHDRSTTHLPAGDDQGLGLRNIFSGLSLADGQPPMSAPPMSFGSNRALIKPADNLFEYLRSVRVPLWDDWPHPTGARPIAGSGSGMGLGMGMWPGGGGRGRRGKWEDMGWEWGRRLEEAEKAKPHRVLRGWEGSSRGWERDIIEFQKENVPAYPIDLNNRWGIQIFALQAKGYDTLEFYDDSLDGAEDKGLLSWLSGSILQTAVSTLHMLRYSSQNFTFHLIPSIPPPSHHPPHNGKHFLWDGFGSMVLVNKADDTDRSMVIEIRPPSVVDAGVIKEFAKGRGGGEWWAMDREGVLGEVGQANLLQAQVYDACVQNQVYFFAVTNLKLWVFGQFSPDYTCCTVSPVLDRKAREPSLMQCLTTWVIRSVDERPRVTREQRPGSVRRTASRLSRRNSQPHPRPAPAPPDQAPPHYTEEQPRRHRQHMSLPAQNVFDEYNRSFVQPHVPPPHSMTPQSSMGTMGMGPGYFDLPPGPGPGLNGMTPGGGYNQPNGMGFGVQNGWGQRPFSPNGAGNMPYNNGVSWYSGGMFPAWPHMG